VKLLKRITKSPSRPGGYTPLKNKLNGNQKESLKKAEIPSVSVIIVNYKLAEEIKKHISILFEEDIPIEVIIVDNSESEEQRKILYALTKKLPIKLIVNQKNLGFGCACNVALLQSRGKYIFFLNPDAYITKGSLKKLFLFAEKYKIDAAGPRIYLDDSLSIKQPPFYPPLFITTIFHNLFPNIFSKWWRKYSYKFWKNKKPFEVNFLSGAAFLIKRELAGFDNRFFMYFEDADLFMRLKKLSKKFFLYPDASVVHKFDLSPSSKKNTFFERSKQKFYAKHYPLLKHIIDLSEKHKKFYIYPGARPIEYFLENKSTQELEIALSGDFVPFVRARLDYNNLPSFIERKKKLLIARKRSKGNSD